MKHDCRILKVVAAVCVVVSGHAAFPSNVLMHSKKLQDRSRSFWSFDDIFISAFDIFVFELDGVEVINFEVIKNSPQMTTGLVFS